MHSQGTSYTGSRGKWELLATLIMDAIGVPRVFGSDQQHMLDWMIYARRPDGQMLRDGDNDINNLPLGQYYSSSKYNRALIHTGNYFNNPYLKGEGLRQMSLRPLGDQSLNCVEFLIFNDPDLEGKPLNDLPLTSRCRFVPNLL